MDLNIVGTINLYESVAQAQKFIRDNVKMTREGIEVREVLILNPRFVSFRKLYGESISMLIAFLKEAEMIVANIKDKIDKIERLMKKRELHFLGKDFDFAIRMREVLDKSIYEMKRFLEIPIMRLERYDCLSLFEAFKELLELAPNGEPKPPRRIYIEIII